VKASSSCSDDRRDLSPERRLAVEFVSDKPGERKKISFDQCRFSAVTKSITFVTNGHSFKSFLFSLSR